MRSRFVGFRGLGAVVVLGVTLSFGCTKSAEGDGGTSDDSVSCDAGWLVVDGECRQLCAEPSDCGDRLLTCDENLCVAKLCSHDPCFAGVGCEDVDGAFACGDCPSGYAGNGETCTDINECDGGTSPCDALATCVNTAGGHTCTCPSEGYRDTNGDGTVCTDIDECALDANHCGENSTCVNTAGGVTCGCVTGYSRFGETCVDDNECTLGTDDCDAVATCVDTVGGHTCTCPSEGYLDTNGDGTVCTDIDECALDSNHCGDNSTCVNTAGGATCGCVTGYTRSGEVCVDDNECTLGTDDCDESTVCNNTPGSYECGCGAGYARSGETCVDDDECTLGTDDCDANATCSNTPGSYECVCSTGYTEVGGVCMGNPCDASTPPTYGAVGDCTAALLSGQSCTPVCNSGYDLTKATTCSLGVLTAGECSGACGVKEYVVAEPVTEADCGALEMNCWYTANQLPRPGSTEPFFVLVEDEGEPDDVLIGFNFTYYGKTFSSVFVSDNGYISFDDGRSGDLSQAGSKLPGAGGVRTNMIAGFWADSEMESATGSTVRYETLGQSPTRRFVVQFEITLNASTDNRINRFQIVLHEDTQAFDIIHGDVSGATVANALHTQSVGFNNGDGSKGEMLAYGNNTDPRIINVNTKWSVTPAAEPVCGCLSAAGVANRSCETAVKLFALTPERGFQVDARGAVDPASEGDSVWFEVATEGLAHSSGDPRGGKIRVRLMSGQDEYDLAVFTSQDFAGCPTPSEAGNYSCDTTDRAVYDPALAGVERWVFEDKDVNPGHGAGCTKVQCDEGGADAQAFFDDRPSTGDGLKSAWPDKLYIQVTRTATAGLCKEFELRVTYE